MSETREYPSPELLQCPYAFYEEGRADGIRKADGRDAYLVFRHPEIAWILSHEELFTAYIPAAHTSLGLDVGDAVHLGAQDGAEHKSNRELLSRPFTPGRLRGYAPMIRGHVDALVDGFARRGRVELVSELAYPLPALVISDLMGLPTSGERAEFLQAWNVAFTKAESQPQEEFAAMHEYLRAEIATRLAEPTDDILSEFLQLQIARDGEHDPDLADCFAAEMIAGGVVTTGQMIANAMLLLLREHGELADPSPLVPQIPALLEETLRVESPVQWRKRVPLQDVEIAGFTIPAGAEITMVYGAANRDERVFDAPDAFRLGRRNVKRHFGFGLGNHYCLGAPLARLEGKLALETLFGRLRRIRLAGPETELRNLESLIFRAPRSLELAFEEA